MDRPNPSHRSRQLSQPVLVRWHRRQDRASQAQLLIAKGMTELEMG
ncbi:hypothetical protein ACSYAD_22775 [Acaryochloris marina NIES-2412]